MLAGERVDTAIEAVLKGAKCVVVVWTRASVAKEWVVSEADTARKRGVLIPVLFDDVEPPLAFRMVHTADLVNWSGDTSAPDLDHLAKAIARLTGSRPDPPPDVDPKSGALKKVVANLRTFVRRALPVRGNAAALTGALLLGGIGGYAISYVVHWDVLKPVKATAEGCLGGGMAGDGKPLPDGGDSPNNARPISPGLYVARRPIPDGTVKYFKVLLHESETTLTISSRDQDWSQGNILDSGWNSVAGFASAVGRHSASVQPQGAGPVFFTLGGSFGGVNAGSAIGICVQ
jgi:hypothetical protein